MLLYWVKITYRMTSCLTTDARGCAECSLEPISTKDLLKWAVNSEQNGGGGIRKKPTNYGKYSIEMVNILPNAGFLQPTASIRGEEEKRHINSTLSTVRIAPFQATPEVFWTMLK